MLTQVHHGEALPPPTPAPQVHLASSPHPAFPEQDAHHAVAGDSPADPPCPHSSTCLARTQALGSDVAFPSREEGEAKTCLLLKGRVAQEKIFHLLVTPQSWATQGPGALPRSPICVAGSQTFGSSSTAFLKTLIEMLEWKWNSWDLNHTTWEAGIAASCSICYATMLVTAFYLGVKS